MTAEKEHPTEERTTEVPYRTGGKETAESRGGGTYGGVQLGEGGRNRTYFVLEGATGGVGHAAGGDPYSQGGK